MTKRKIFIGTSGWMYKHWGERFYPKDLKKGHLIFYSCEFQTVEINSSFYRMPSEHAFKIWLDSTPKNFIFAIKLNQYITHRKRLIMDEESKSYLISFLKHTQTLQKKLSVILIQLPPTFQKNIARLKDFLTFYDKQIKDLEFQPLSAIEFRHASWMSEDVFEILKKYKTALVIAGTPEIGDAQFTSNFTYIRMHGDENHSSNYKNKDLLLAKNKIDYFPKNIKRIYIYFNNDYSAYAIDNARFLISLFKK